MSKKNKKADDTMLAEPVQMKRYEVSFVVDVEDDFKIFNTGISSGYTAWSPVLEHQIKVPLAADFKVLPSVWLPGTTLKQVTYGYPYTVVSGPHEMRFGDATADAYLVQAADGGHTLMRSDLLRKAE